MKFLIIDDNSNMRNIIRQTICSMEDSVVECYDGDEALSAYINHQPDYVLMDIQMQNMDGLTTTQKIIERFPYARIIIITDYDTQSFRLAAKKAGALAFVSKENLFEVSNYINGEKQRK